MDQMTVTVKNTNQLTNTGTAKTVIYGPAKIGKTRLSLTWPGCIIVNTEQGLLSLRGLGVPYIDAHDKKSLQEAVQWLYSSAANKFPNVMVDSSSDLGEVILGDHKSASKDPRKAYGNTQDDVMECWRAFRDLPKNVVFIAKEAWDTSRVPPTVAPSMPGKYLTQQLPYMFDGIYRMTHVTFSDGVPRVGLHCKPDFQTIAGDRSGKLDEWEPPDLTHIFNKILKG